MGLDISEYQIMDGLVTLTDLYGHVRNIQINKNDGVYTIECIFYIYKGSRCIDSIYIRKEYSTDFLTKTWEDVYTIVKEKLDTAGINYNNNI